MEAFNFYRSSTLGGRASTSNAKIRTFGKANLSDNGSACQVNARCKIKNAKVKTKDSLSGLPFCILHF
jgi:hypothetical protein